MTKFPDGFQLGEVMIKGQMLEEEYLGSVISEVPFRIA